MTEANRQALARQEEEEGISLEEETTEEGRYIPYSGGCMGWFENSGVLKCELPNNYLFYTAMQSDRVRSKQFQRWGERFNRRGNRRRYRRDVEASLVTDGGAVRGTTRDISLHGVRLQFLEEVKLERGQACTVRLHESESDATLVELNGKVVWFEKLGAIRPVWNVGMTLEQLTPEQRNTIAPLLQD